MYSVVTKLRDWLAQSIRADHKSEMMMILSRVAGALEIQNRSLYGTEIEDMHHGTVYSHARVQAYLDFLKAKDTNVQTKFLITGHSSFFASAESILKLSVALDEDAKHSMSKDSSETMKAFRDPSMQTVLSLSEIGMSHVPREWKEATAKYLYDVWKECLAKSEFTFRIFPEAITVLHFFARFATHSAASQQVLTRFSITNTEQIVKVASYFSSIEYVPSTHTHVLAEILKIVDFDYVRMNWFDLLSWMFWQQEEWVGERELEVEFMALFQIWRCTTSGDGYNAMEMALLFMLIWHDLPLKNALLSKSRVPNANKFVTSLLTPKAESKGSRISSVSEKDGQFMDMVRKKNLVSKTLEDIAKLPVGTEKIKAELAAAISTLSTTARPRAKKRGIDDTEVVECMAKLQLKEASDSRDEEICEICTLRNLA